MATEKKRPTSIEDRAFMAQVMQHAGKYEEMFEFIKEMIQTKKNDFTTEERNLMLMSFKKVVQRDREAIKLVRDIQKSDKFSQFSHVLSTFKLKLHDNIVSRCEEIT